MASKRDTTVLVIVLLVTAALGAAGVAALKRAEARRAQSTTEPPPELGVAVGIAVARSRTIAVQVDASGFLQPFEQLTISTQVPGHVENQYVEVSDRVNAGDMLFQLDASLRTTAVEKARAAVDRADSELKLAVDNLNRMQRLEAQRSTNPTEVLQVETQHAIAQAMLKKAQAALREALIMLDKMLIRAPITGEIALVHTRQGEYAHAGQPLVDIMESDRLKLIVQLSDREIVAFAPQDPVTMRPSALPGETFAGQVLRIHPRATLDSRMFEVEIEVPNADHRLRPGFHVHATLHQKARHTDKTHHDVGSAVRTAQTKVVTIPRAAVFENYRRKYCYVVKKRGDDDRQHAVRTPIDVAPLLSDLQHVQVLTGVQPGDRVITTGLQHVTHQSIVRVIDQ
ncbi:MAG: efflux RND transporter periplasmic adaptor subunit [Phycisphaerae bacterium]